MVGELLGDGVKPERIFRLQFDDLPDLKRLSMPLIDLVDWYSKNILHQTLNQAANENQSPFLLLDEVQNLADWAPQLKHLVDIGRMRAYGETHRNLRQQAFAAFSERGGYPVAQVRTDMTWEKVADFLNETVIRRAIQHDLRMGPRGQRRDEHLLEEVLVTQLEEIPIQDPRIVCLPLSSLLFLR